MISEVIFKRGTDGKIRTWQVEVEGPAYRVIAGIQGGKLVTSKWKTAKPKNIGKKNETTPEQQAQLEAVADRVGKLKREYRCTIPELEFVPDGPMLAQSYDELKEPLDFRRGVYHQPKLDGIRSMKTLKFGATTRELQPHQNCGHLMAALAPLFAKIPGLQLDGELYNHAYHGDFEKISSLVRREKLTAEQKDRVENLLQYHVYDMPSDGDTFGGRSTRLKLLIEELNHPMIVFVPTKKVESPDELDEANAESVAAGYEGQMVRVDEGHYDFDSRSWSLMKRKGFTTAEFPLDDIHEGEGNWGGVAKSVTVTLADGTACDGGIRGDEDFCRQLLIDRKLYNYSTIRYFGLTANGKLRHAVAIDFHREGRVD